jgi:enamine deaminase RidA (YjgF/YER057c/UK114 family)
VVCASARVEEQGLALAVDLVPEAGAALGDVVRTRVYLIDISRWEEAARAHREAFGEVRPASSFVEVSRLADPEMLVEIEAVAVTGAAPPPVGR